MKVDNSKYYKCYDIQWPNKKENYVFLPESKNKP